MKFVLNIRHRPTMDETIEACFERFVGVMRQVQVPWGVVPGKELTLPPVGAGLSTTTQLRNKLGTGITGRATFSYRAQANLRDVASHDDSLVVEFDARKKDWRDLVCIALPSYVHAMCAYVGSVYRWEESSDEWEKSSAISRSTGKDIDGRDGFFRIGPLSFMDRELCRRGCNGMTPEQIVVKLTGTVPDVRLFEDGVLIVAADHFPEQREIIATDRAIRERLGLPVWSGE